MRFAVPVALATAVLLVIGAGTHTPSDPAGFVGFGGLSFAVAALAFSFTGARVPRRPLGAIFAVTGSLLGVGNLLCQYADFALFIAPGAPFGALAATMQNVLLTPCIGLLALVVALFPDRHPRASRAVVGAALAGSGLLALSYLLRSGPLDPPFDGVENPFGVGPRALFDGLSGLGWLLTSGAVLAAAVGFAVRLRRAHGERRQQLKWLALVGALVGVEIVLNLVSFFAGIGGIDVVREAALGITLTAFPLAAGIAIMRYRLYDVDVVINRALVYGTLTATLAAAYVGSVLLLQLLLSPSSDLAIAGSTLAVAAMFRPALARIQELVDRRFYRRKYDAQRTLETFAARLRDEVALEVLSAELRGVVQETMQPAHLTIWLKP